MPNDATQLAVIGLPMTETFTISETDAPLMLSFEPIGSSLAFGRNGAAYLPTFTHSGRSLTLSGLTVGDVIRVNYKTMDAVEWSGMSADFLLIYQTAKL